MVTLMSLIDASRSEARIPNLDAQTVDPLPAHVGVWLDRCLLSEEANADPTKSKEEKQEGHPCRRMLHAVAIRALRPNDTRSPAVAAYRELFERYQEDAKKEPAGTLRCVVEASAKSRVLLHPATGSTVTEGGLLLHHTYGVPYLPGSALKGVCRHRAERLQAEGFSPFGEASPADWPNLLFGFTAEGETGGESGLFDFWDALWIPSVPEKSSNDWSPLVEDIVNPHHSDYYTKQEGRPPPSDGDAPIPTHSLTVAPKTRFLIVVESAVQDSRVKNLLEWVIGNLLAVTLREDGIGARTRSGYGRLELDLPKGIPIPTKQQRPPADIMRHRGSVSRNKSDRSLRARMDGVAGDAIVREPAAKAIFESLPENVRKDLERGRNVLLLVTWEHEGNARKITALAVDPAGAR